MKSQNTHLNFTHRGENENNLNYSPGRPTVSNTITIVINPAWGMPAAPMEAAVAVTLEIKIKGKFSLKAFPRTNAKVRKLNLPHGNDMTEG
jgi:hypothetical protein